MHSMLCEHTAVLVTKMKIRTYSELIMYDSFLDRFKYLKLDGQVGNDTFGFDRYLNQVFYNSIEWQRARDNVILRDNGCDLGIEGREIETVYDLNSRTKRRRKTSNLIIHHMNPISIEDVKNRNPIIFNPEFLITTVLRTHNAIHYGNVDNLSAGPIERKINDTIPWRR